jgi:uncharacterized protein (TIGR00369 family)
MNHPPDTPAIFEPKMLDGSPLGRALEFQTVAMEPSIATLKAPYKPEMVGDPDTGVIAGGVVTALLDHACGQSIFAALGQPVSIATLDLRIDYMRAAEPGLDIFARAHCYKLTHSIGFVRAVAYDRAVEDPVATAQAAFMLNTGEPLVMMHDGPPDSAGDAPGVGR